MDKHDTNTSSILATIQLNGFRFNRLKFEYNQEFNQVEQVKLAFDLNHDVQINDAENTASVMLSCTVFPDPVANNYPFTVEAVVVGAFSFDASIDSAERDTRLSENALAILFPYLRSAIAAVTTSAGVNPLLLPVINVVEYVKDRGVQRTRQDGA